MTEHRDRLLDPADRDELDHRWSAIETGFVEDPGRHVELADDLLADLIERVLDRLQADRERLSTVWRGGDVTTEQLRELLLQYRTTYERFREIGLPDHTT